MFSRVNVIKIETVSQQAMLIRLLNQINKGLGCLNSIDGAIRKCRFTYNIFEYLHNNPAFEVTDSVFYILQVC